MSVETRVAESDAAWQELLRRTMLSLDEKGMRGLEASRKVAEKKLSRIDGGRFPVDRERVVAFLLGYSSGEKYLAAADKAGIDRRDLVLAFDLWPEARMVRDYVRYVNERLREEENEELREKARCGLEKLVTKEGCELNAKAVIFANERLDRKHFGDPRVDKQEPEAENRSLGGGGIIINIVADAAKKCEAPASVGGPAAVFIDV